MSKHKTIKRAAVSYSWRVEGKAPENESVAEFVRRLEARDILVIYDKQDNDFGADLEAFMRDVGGADRLFVFLSPAYLQSVNCMYELLTAWRGCSANPESFRERVFAWTMDGVKISELKDRAEYIRYWNREFEENAELMREFGEKASAQSQEQHRRINEFRNHIDDILSFFGKTLLPRNFSDFSSWMEDEFPIAGEHTAGRDPRQAFDDTITGMEDILKRNTHLRNFLANTTTGLVEASDPPKLTDEVRKTNFDSVPHLKAIAREMYNRPTGETIDKDLKLFAGGLAVLALDSEWILNARRKLKQNEPCEFPSTYAYIPLANAANAYFLYIISAGLADGMARLDKVFGPPPNLADPPPGEFKGVSRKHQLAELKRHFVNYILKVTPKDEDLDNVFQGVRDELRFALHERKDPYVGASPRYDELRDLIHKHLELTDFYILLPKGGTADEAYTKSYFTMQYLYEIYSHF